MAQLTTSYQWINGVNVGTAYGVTYSVGIYAKYSRTTAQEQALKSTLHILVRAYNNGSSTLYGSTGTWHGTFNGALNNEWNIYATNYGGQTKDLYETSFEVTHNADGTYSTNIGATSVYDTAFGGSYTIGSTQLVMPTIVVAPSITINGAGSSSTNRLVMSGNTNMSVTLTNCNGLSTQIRLRIPNTTYDELLATRTTNGTFNVSIPIAVWSTLTDKSTTDLARIVAKNSKGEGQNLCHLALNDTIVPTISSVVLSGTNTITALGNNFVKGITIPKITTTASGVQGSTISTYTLTELTGFDGALPKTITNPFDGTRPFLSSPVIAKVYVTDSRQRQSAVATSNSVNVIDYSEPTMSVEINRCTSAGVLNEEGTYGKLVVTYNISPINNGSTNLNTKTLEYSLNGGENWTAITLSTWSGTINKVIGGSFATNQNYQVYVRLKDINKEINRILEISPSFTTISLYNGGKGVTLGQVASEEGFNVYMDTDFKGEVTKNGQPLGSVVNTHSTSQTDTYSCNYVNGKVGIVLYENTTGSNGSITLSDSSANYDTIEIFGYRTFSGSYTIKGSAKVHKPNGNRINLSLESYHSTAVVMTKAIHNMLFNGNQLQKVRTITFNVGSDGAVSVTSGDATSVYITKVVGYK